MLQSKHSSEIHVYTCVQVRTHVHVMCIYHVPVLRYALIKAPLCSLGGGIKDAEEVKKHVFFEPVNWEDLYNRKVSRGAVGNPWWSLWWSSGDSLSVRSKRKSHVYTCVHMYIVLTCTYSHVWKC